jgi:putative ABC transport system ATP-binding protein
MIRLTNITKTFGKGSPNEVPVFRDFNLEVAKNDFIVLVGSNGSGKSTLLNLLSGTTKPDRGSITLDGKEITRLHEYERSRWIARIFQDPLSGTAPELTVLENFRLAAIRTRGKGLRIGTGEAFRSRVRDRVRLLNLGLETKLNQPMGSLSGGQRQSLALLMAIMDDTRLLLLDEPAAALDPRTSTIVMELADKVIREFSLTALLVTHRLRDVVDYGNRVVQLKEGKIARDFRKENEYELNMKAVFEWFEP